MGELTQQGGSPQLIVIPGFLTEPHRLAQEHKSSALDAIDPSAYLDRRAWLKSMRCVCDESVDVTCFEWGSQSALHMLTDLISPFIFRKESLSQGKRDFSSQISRIARELHSSWRASRDEADRAVDQLCELIITSPNPSSITLVAHSLGGRIALKAIDRLYRSGERSLPKLSAWAPAISLSEMSCDSISQLTDPPEIVYSGADLVLKYIFPLGQGPAPQMNLLGGLTILATLMSRDQTQCAIGLIGPPKSAIELNQISQDLTHLPMTHLGYLPATEAIFRSSPYLSLLLPSSLS